MSAVASPGPERRQTTPQTQMIGVRWTLLIVLLGGRSAEELLFGDVTTGAERDLVEATRLARRMVTPTRYWSAIGRLRKSR